MLETGLRFKRVRRAPPRWARSQAMDELIRTLWAQAVEQTPKNCIGIALVALGGYDGANCFRLRPWTCLYLLVTDFRGGRKAADPAP